MCCGKSRRWATGGSASTCAFPSEAKELSEPRGFFSDNAYIERWRIQRAGGLDGQTIHIDGLAATKIDVLARIERADGVTQTARLLPDSPSFVVEATPSGWKVSATYLALRHRAHSAGHRSPAVRPRARAAGERLEAIVGTITAFTVAHSITLAAAALGFVHVPGPPVEACIALSIVFVAAEIIRGRQGKPGLTERAPWVVAFTFGLLHGLGFAGALSEVGLPQQAIPLALLFFNVGVELGQLAFICACSVSSPIRHLHVPAPAWGWRVMPYAIGSVAMFWVIERTVAF